MSNTEHARVASYLSFRFNAYNGALPLNRPIIVSYDTSKRTIPQSICYLVVITFNIYTLLYPFLVHPSPVIDILGRRRKIAPDLAIAPNEPYVPKPTVPYPGPPPSDTNVF